MKTENKYKWMVWAIVILALMNIATLITIVYHRNQSGETGSVAESKQVQSEDASLRYSGRFFRDQLNLNREQMSKFVQINPGFRQDVRGINYNLARMRQGLLSEMAADKCDTIRINMLSDSIGILHSNLKKLTCRYYMDIKNICDKQQQEKLEQLFGEMFATNVQMAQYGKRGTNGRGRGRRFNIQ